MEFPKIPYVKIRSIKWFSKFIILPMTPFIVSLIIRFIILNNSLLNNITTTEFTFSMFVLSLLILSNTNKIEDKEISQSLFNVFAIFTIIYIVFLVLVLVFEILMMKQINQAISFFSNMDMDNSIPNKFSDYVSKLSSEDYHYYISTTNLMSVITSIFVIPISLLCKKMYNLEV